MGTTKKMKYREEKTMQSNEDGATAKAALIVNIETVQNCVPQKNETDGFWD